MTERVEITGTIVEQARRLAERLKIESFTAFDKTSDQPNLQKYPTRAFQEAVVNALVHRDYESDQPVRVTVLVNRNRTRVVFRQHRHRERFDLRRGLAIQTLRLPPPRRNVREGMPEQRRDAQPHARMSRRTLPCTSVRRKSRPP